MTCAAPCKLVLTGSVKVGGRKLRLTKLKRTLSGAATLTLRVDKRDLKLLRRARGKAKASIVMTVDGAAQRLAVALKA